MSEQLSAHKFKGVYEDLGYDLSKLGCIMLDLEQPEGLSSFVDQVFQPDDFYYSANPDRFWIQGNVTDQLHATLLYGLLRSGSELKKHVNTVLEHGSAVPSSVTIDHIGTFDSQLPDENYWCVIAHLRATDELVGANERLKFLPHINTFPGFKAHATLAYVKRNKPSSWIDEAVGKLNDGFLGFELKAKGLNYGGQP